MAVSALTIIVVTDLTMINKTTRDGQMLVYAVDRKSGEPRPTFRSRSSKQEGRRDGQDRRGRSPENLGPKRSAARREATGGGARRR